MTGSSIHPRTFDRLTVPAARPLCAVTSCLAVLARPGRELSALDTPCIQVCVIDPATRLCSGCGRTLAEIAQWSGLGTAERRRIMGELPERRRAMTSSGAK